MSLKDKKAKTDKQKYLKQIDAYYSKQLSSHAIIELGMTPKSLQELGAPALPLIIQQSTVTKCIRKSTGSRSAHELSRDIIEKLPEQINSPIFLEKKQLCIVDDKKAERLSRIVGLQLPMAETTFDCKKNIAPHANSVKNN